MIYKLNVYHKAGDFLHLVHTYLNEDKEPLEEIAHEHMSNNGEYVTILIAYKAHEVQVF